MSDLIDRRDAIDALVKLTNCNGVRELFEYVQEHHLSDMWSGGIVDAIDAVIAVPAAEPEPKWIPCSERLPEKDTHFYLTTIANHGLNFTTTLPDDVDVVRWDYDRRKGHNSWHWCTERTVIAWMPLPEPYREEGECDV